jgi:two-component system sensor histidine kinase/response regulator
MEHESDEGERKILIVDDAPANIKLLGEGFRQDYKVSACTSGEAALKIARSEAAPDLILLDIEMPGMDGYEVCRQLMADEATRAIPVIFITARTGEEDEQRGLELGAVDYITKPFSIEIARARVRTHLALKAAREKLERQYAALSEAEALKEEVERITRHDLKSPLCAIIGMPQAMLFDNNITDTQREYLRTIEAAGYRMLNMVNMSLDLFKMERGTYEFAPREVNLLEVLERIAIEVTSLAAPRELELRVELQGRPAREEDSFNVQGEELLCYSMLANLIKNALEASPNGATVTIRCTTTDEAHEVTVHNSGAVPKAIRESFFDRYSTSGKRSGTGLGTYSARLVAETQGGQVEMQTSEQEGTTLLVRLPRG